jgi:PAS domain S-box-containing protein
MGAGSEAPPKGEGSGVVSERRTASTQLLATEELNRRIIEAMPGGVVHVSSDGSIHFANAEAQRILGLGYDTLTHRYTRDFEPETVREDGSPCPLAEYPVTKALVTGEPQPPMTIGVRRPDGQTSWAIFTAVPVFAPRSTEVTGAVVTFLDVTESKRAERALRHSEGLLRSILDSTPNPIAVADRDGKLTFANRLPPSVNLDEVMGRPVWHHLRPEDHPTARAALERVLATGQPDSYEATGLTGVKWLVHLGPRYEGSDIVGVTFVAWDVTRQKELETHLTVADRMASIGTLAAGIVHEINNPLTYVLVNLEWLAKKGQLEDATHARVAAALEGADRIRGVVSDVRTFSSAGNAQRYAVDVRQVLDAALRIAQAEVRQRARVVTRYDEVPPVLASEGRLGQVFLNLLINAAQAIEVGDPRKNEITVTAGRDDAGRVVVSVSDTGIGIAPELLGTIFEPFVTTKPQDVGTGLGLYICRNVVNALGGELTVTSTLGIGSTFSVVLPAAVFGSHGVEHAAEQVPDATRRLRILVVDDEVAIVSMLKLLLVDHDVALAYTAVEAAEAIEKTDFDLVFCDVVMPEQSGIEVYEALRARRPGRESTVVFMTGGAFTDRARRFLGSVPNAILEKPFTLDDVMRVIRSVAG